MGRPLFGPCLHPGPRHPRPPVIPGLFIFSLSFLGKNKLAHSEPQTQPPLGRLPWWLPAAQTAHSSRRPSITLPVPSQSTERARHGPRGAVVCLSQPSRHVSPQLVRSNTHRHHRARTRVHNPRRALDEQVDRRIASLSSRKLRQASLKFPTISVDSGLPQRYDVAVPACWLARSPWPRLNSRGGRSLR